MWKEISEVPDLESYGISSLRLLIYGSAPTPIPVIQKLQQVFKGEYVLQMGMTETGLNCVLDSKDVIRKNLSIGKPTMFVEERIVNDQEKDVEIGEVGEIVLRGPTVTAGYYKLPEATREAKKGGWFHGGDLAKFDEEGFIYIVDRKKDMIKSGGENVYSREVENVLEAHPKILEAAVVGVPDEKWDEAVKAFVVLKSGEQMTAEEVIAYCKEHLAGFKKPKHVQFISALPRNAVNRVMKGELKKMSKNF
jgi:acyl-CoA synthetase (AMP-forming)/AMP-acid ligase II